MYRAQRGWKDKQRSSSHSLAGRFPEPHQVKRGHRLTPERHQTRHTLSNLDCGLLHSCHSDGHRSLHPQSLLSALRVLSLILSGPVCSHDSQHLLGESATSQGRRLPAHCLCYVTLADNPSWTSSYRGLGTLCKYPWHPSCMCPRTNFVAFPGLRRSVTGRMLFPATGIVNKSMIHASGLRLHFADAYGEYCYALR